VDIFITGACVILAGCGWLMVCNWRTYRQLGRIMNWVFSQEDWEHQAARYRLISYDAYLWRLFTLRDPMKLYPPEFRAAFAK
jgi:hypothetical protein